MNIYLLIYLLGVIISALILIFDKWDKLISHSSQVENTFGYTGAKIIISLTVVIFIGLS